MFMYLLNIREALKRGGKTQESEWKYKHSKLKLIFS